MLSGEVLSPLSMKEWVTTLNAEWHTFVRTTVEAIVAYGRRLHRAKEDVGHGNFLKLLDKLDMGSRRAQQIMKIAEHPVLSDAQHAAHLPPHWTTLSELLRVPADRLKQYIADGTVHSEMERSQAEFLIPVQQPPPANYAPKMPPATGPVVNLAKECPPEPAGEPKFVNLNRTEYSPEELAEEIERDRTADPPDLPDNVTRMSERSKWKRPAPAEPLPESKRPRLKREKTVFKITLNTIDQIIRDAATFSADDLNDFGAELAIRAKTLLDIEEEAAS